MEALVRIQDIKPLKMAGDTSWPNPTFIIISIECSNDSVSWSLAQPSWEIEADEYVEKYEELRDFYLHDYPHCEEYRWKIESNTQQPVGLTFRYRNLFAIVEYQVLIGGLILSGVYILIVFELLHRTIAAMIGSFICVAVISIVHGRPSFVEVINWIDFDTVGLLFGMMIMVGIFSDTGFFEWSAIKAYKLSRGNLWHLTVILCTFTAVTSAFLDNVTTILLLAPVTIRLCKVLDVDPEPLLLAEVMLSNIGGTSTAIGDPPNIIIINDPSIKESGLVTFFSFSFHMMPGVIISAIPVFVFLYWKNRQVQRKPRQSKEREILIWKQTASSIKDGDSEEERKVKQQLFEYISKLQQDFSEGPDEEAKVVDIHDLEEKYTIHDMPLFISSCIVLGCVILMFFLHSWIKDYLELSLSWVAIIGAMIHLLVSGKKDIDEVLEKVELATLLFFAGLFVLMRGLEILGLIDWIGEQISHVISLIPPTFQLFSAIMIILWVSAFVSAFIDNIPYTTAMVPVILTLSHETNLPLAPLVWSLAFGACFGGNGTLVGASANVVACGLSFPLSFIFILFINYYLLLLLLLNCCYCFVYLLV